MSIFLHSNFGHNLNDSYETTFMDKFQVSQVVKIKNDVSLNLTRNLFQCVVSLYHRDNQSKFCWILVEIINNGQISIRK